MRKLTVLLIVLSLSAICIATGISGENAGIMSSTRPNAAQRQLGATIDGAKNPDLIPDEAAYALLFRLMSDHPSEEGKSHVRAYIRHLGLGNQKCQSCPYSSEAGDEDIDALISVAEEFHERVKALDEKAREIKDAHWPDPLPDAMAQLETLQREKEKILASAIGSLPGKLSSKGLMNVRQQIRERIKRKMKIESTPLTPPTDPSWHQSPGKHH